jgi:hypothetical protein
MKKRFSALRPLLVLVALSVLSGCSWQNDTKQHAIYNCTFNCVTAGNVLNANYIDPSGSKIENYKNYLPYFSGNHSLTSWTFDYDLNATMITTFSDGTTIQEAGTYYSMVANEGKILVTNSTSGEQTTLTWNDVFVDSAGYKTHSYFEFYMSRTYNIEALGGDVTVWMLYHSSRIW